MALPAGEGGVPRLRAEWDALAAELIAADVKCRGGLTDEVRAAEDEWREVDARVNACARRILAEPARTLADLFPLGEAVYSILYCMPCGEVEILLEAVVAIIKGVRDVGMRAAISPPAAPLNAARDNYLASDWHRIVAGHLHHMAGHGKTDAEVEELQDRLCAETEAIWAKPCGTWDDLVVRAAIACHWNEPPHVGDPAYPDIISGDRDEYYDNRALAHVVRGVLDLAGLAFDAEGRLLSGQGMQPSATPPVGE